MTGDLLDTVIDGAAAEYALVRRADELPAGSRARGVRVIRGEAAHPARLDATGIDRRRTVDGPHILTDTTEWVLGQ
ncbi:hypothetical protein [Streptomyces niveus]|uniref:hypothetical protein n=1 Tax=Streptomyces niveus TaxID=193462 RepID=UPI0036D2DDDF